LYPFWLGFILTEIDVCGGFPKQWPNEKDFDTFTEVQSINKFILKTILDQPYPKNANVRILYNPTVHQH
jgi:hypothetical protein